MFWLVLLGLALLAAAGNGDEKEGDQPVTNSAGYDQIRELGARAGLSATHVNFLLLVARGESGGNNLRGLGIPEMFPPGTIPTQNAGAAGRNEARAAAAAYRQNRAQGRFDECGSKYPDAAYGFGSGGWFAFLPSYALSQFPKGSGLRCLPPSAVFDPIASICMAIGFARGLQGYGGFQRVPTVLNLRGGWGRPGQMGSESRLNSIRAYYDKQARSIGLPAGFVDQRISRFPGIDLAALYYQLGGKAPP
jgi:hypothetical protein